VSHAPIPGYMDAMAMPFTVRDSALLKDVAAGDRVRFDLAVSATSSVIDRLDIVSAPRVDVALQRTPAVSKLVPLGQPFPDFSLLDQHGKPFALSQLKGQVVLVTFIYTRCPLPDYCPLLMANFARIKKEFAPSLGHGVALVTITFDPQYDTSEVLSRYGAPYGSDDGGWHLLTGSTEQVRHVTELFGIEFYPDEGMITHTMLTTVIAPDGKLFATLEGKNYSIGQLADIVRAARQQPLP
jgi:protein SCO1/2